MNRNIILMFHQIGDADWFKSAILSIRKEYSLVSSDELFALLKDRNKKGAHCNVSFDDGHKLFYDKVFPVLKSMNIPATLFVSPLKTRQQENFWFQQIRGFDKVKFHALVKSRVAQHFTENISNFSVLSVLKSLRIATIQELINEFRADNNLTATEFMNVSEAQLLEIMNSGLVEIGAHTQNHPILANEDDETAKKEIMDSIAELSAMLGNKVKYFAYPNGRPEMDFGLREMKLLCTSEVEAAYSTEPGPIRQSSSFYALPRIGLSKGSIWMTGFKVKHAQLWDTAKNLLIAKSEQNERRQLIRIRKI